MCGIAGLSSLSTCRKFGDGQAVVDHMIEAIVHRGPDARGTIALGASVGTAPAVVMGNTRLAIQDLTDSGSQPMHDPATGNWIVFNGEIYNHLEVRNLLGSTSRAWHSRSDTETVLHAYAEWGPKCLERFRGMFALAIWNEASRELWMARDRVGIKPLYFFEGPGFLLFASEVRALLASGCVPLEVNRQALSGYVRFGSVIEPQAVCSAIRSLPAGSWARIRGGAIREIRPYWDASDSVVEPYDRGEAAERLRVELERSVDEHLVSDVPVASFLSGGVDSGIVTALAARLSSAPVEAFTVGFEDAVLDETDEALALAKMHGIRHNVVRLSDEAVAARVPEAVAAMDLPSVDGVNSFVVSEAVAQAGFKVVLSGLGGDELFGGYPGFRSVPQAHRWAPLVGRFPAGWRRRLAGGGGRGDRAVALTASGAPLASRYDALRSLWSGEELRRLGLMTGASLVPAWRVPDADLRTQFSLLELSGYMRSTLLRDADCQSMAHSLELRVPFLDHRFMEHCIRARAASYSQSGENKPLLLRVAGDLLPPRIARRKKMGFVLPMDRWIRGPLRDFFREGISALIRQDVLIEEGINAQLRRFEDGHLGWARVWCLSVLGHWLERNAPQRELRA